MQRKTRERLVDVGLFISGAIGVLFVYVLLKAVWPLLVAGAGMAP